jgi:hypothetical protein
MRITVDTNVLSPSNDLVIARAEALAFDVRLVTVSGREAGTGSSRDAAARLEAVAEAGIFDESQFGQAVFAAEDEESRIEYLLEVIADGGFPAPGNRQTLSPGHRRQLRDAMIFSAHVREGRDIFVTGDEAAFLCRGRRSLLEGRFHTRILTPPEFLAAFASPESG